MTDSNKGFHDLTVKLGYEDVFDLIQVSQKREVGTNNWIFTTREGETFYANNPTYVHSGVGDDCSLGIRWPLEVSDTDKP